MVQAVGLEVVNNKRGIVPQLQCRSALWGPPKR